MTAVHNTFVFSSSQVKEDCVLGLNRLLAANDFPVYSGSVVSFLARYFAISSSAVEQSFDGFGSRRVRVGIAHLVGLKPSDIWFNRPERDMVLDDYDYIYADKPDFIKWCFVNSSKGLAYSVNFEVG